MLPWCLPNLHLRPELPILKRKGEEGCDVQTECPQYPWDRLTIHRIWKNSLSLNINDLQVYPAIKLYDFFSSCHQTLSKSQNIRTVILNVPSKSCRKRPFQYCNILKSALPKNVWFGDMGLNPVFTYTNIQVLYH